MVAGKDQRQSRSVLVSRASGQTPGEEHPLGRTLAIPPELQPMGKAVTHQEKLGDCNREWERTSETQSLPHGAYSLTNGLTQNITEEDQRAEHRKGHWDRECLEGEGTLSGEGCLRRGLA